MSGIKKASFARFFDTFDSIGSVVPIERLSKTMFFDSLSVQHTLDCFLNSGAVPSPVWRRGIYRPAVRHLGVPQGFLTHPRRLRGTFPPCSRYALRETLAPPAKKAYTNHI
nr:hypothetical protein [uncultured Agathobaculum sp.]